MKTLNDLAIFNADSTKWSIIEKKLKFDEIRKNIHLEKNEVAIMHPIFTADSVVLSAKTLTVDTELNENDAFIFAKKYIEEIKKQTSNLYIIKDRLFLNVPIK